MEIISPAITTAATKCRVTITTIPGTTTDITLIITRPVRVLDRTETLPVLATCTKPKTGVRFSQSRQPTTLTRHTQPPTSTNTTPYTTYQQIRPSSELG